ncbi:MAG: transposase [Ekhidna sp.]|nr:transposase [Ekhidna sp.]
MLKTYGIALSMTAKGNPHENALSERVNSLLKQKYGLGKVMEDVDRARQLVGQAMASYNGKRPHHRLGGHTPEQMHGANNWKQDLAQAVSSSGGTKKAPVKADQDEDER